jgi:serpin B
LCLWLTAACNSSKTPTVEVTSKETSPQITPPSSPMPTSPHFESTGAFGFDLYQRARPQSGNFAVAPASVSMALSMTWAGARGETAEEMKRVLHVQGTPAEVMAASGKLAAALQEPSRPVKLRIANRLFGEKSYKFEQPYLDATKAAFGAPLEPLDFKTAFEPARGRINGWVEEQTEKRIKNLIPAQGVNGDTRLVLVNALYFLGDWETPFEKERTHAQPFFLTKGKQKDVPTMHRGDTLRLAEVDGAKALELPYKGGAFSMLFLLPAEVDGLAPLETSLTQKKLDDIVAALKPQLTVVSLPKFEISPPESLSLGDPLKAMGMPLAFDRDKADFTGIANPPSPADRLYIAKVFHKVFVRVDEKGTEAAAASAVSMARAGAAPPKMVEFKADHPFLFLLRDNASGTVLFMGRVADP